MSAFFFLKDMRKFVFLLLLAVPIWGCNRKDDPQPPAHEYTEKEADKVMLQNAFEAFIQALDLHTQEEVRSFIIHNTVVEFDEDGVLHVCLRDDVQKWMDLSLKAGTPPSMELWMQGGLSVRGIPSEVYVGEKRVAQLDIVRLNGYPVPVFRFPDGTTYSLTSLALITPFMDWIIKYALRMYS